MAQLFGRNRLEELASRLSSADFEDEIAIVRSWNEDYKTGTLMKDKETSREQAFNQAFFIKILGYQEKPANPHSLEPKASTVGGQLPDAILGHNDAVLGVQNVSAVVELKGASVDLDRPQRGHGGLTPVQQGFKYKPLYAACPFVIVSNFFEFRLYNDNQLDYEVWTLEQLVDPKNDYLQFKIFYTLLCRENFTAPSGPSSTQSLLLDIRSEQETIGKAFYREYREIRLALIRDLYERNEAVRDNIQLGIEKAQKLVDRLVFACFAEDRGLLPDKAVERMVKAADTGYATFLQSLQGFFTAIDSGDARLGIPTGYNGGLFKADSVLDSLTIGEAVLRALTALCRYDFKEHLSVTILGHIFEQSISDLELIRSEVASEDGVGGLGFSRRKYDGIYYTPDYIVRFIIDQSLGNYLRAEEHRLLVAENVHDRLKEKAYVERERKAYLRYQQVLQTVTVVDPACGSGAFLSHVFDFLLSEHQRVGAILGDVFSSRAYVNQVLRNNIFGVDLNEESVEITKLALWLKSAHRGERLTTLDDNIKCGNSLVEDPKIAGERAFKWSEHFPSVRARAGFDVVVGNPPYVSSETMVRSAPDERQYITEHYDSAAGNWDLFIPFLQKGIDLLRPNGISSMIVPNKVLSSNYASKFRTYATENARLLALADVSSERVFEVDIYPVIVSFEKAPTGGTAIVQVGVDTMLSQQSIPTGQVPENWSELFAESPISTSGTVELRSLFDVYSAASVAEAYELKKVILDDPAASSFKVINTGTIDPYTNAWGLSPMRYLKGAYLHPSVTAAQVRDKAWQGEDKVIVAGMSTSLEACYSSGDEYLPAKSTVVVTGKKDSGIDLRIALALLNSSSVRARFTRSNRHDSMAGGYMTVTHKKIGDLLVPSALAAVQPELIHLVDMTLIAKAKLKDLTIELKTLVEAHGMGRWGSGLDRWWEHELGPFAAALDKKMPLSVKAELLPVFNSRKHSAQALAREADQCLVKVDQIIERLYG